MPKGVYPCFKCGEWFETKGQQKAHVCGVPATTVKAVEEVKVVKPAEVPIENKTDEAIVASIEDSSTKEESAEFNRKESIDKLKDAGVIKDKRSVTHKSDDELKEMLEEILA